MAIREYLIRNGLEVIFFYPAPRAAKVTFRDAANGYWTVESVLPDHLQFVSQDDVADWLYGNLVVNELPHVLPKIRRAS
jgi:superfamily I DNA and/or RNA helicase